MPPMPPSPPPAMAGEFFSGFSAMTASVVRKSAAMEAAFCSAERVTFAGSMMPSAIMSTYSPVAIEAPLKQIAVNAGLEGGVISEKVRNLGKGEGLNAATGVYEDLVKAGIIDPVKVTRSALRNAASIAAMVLTTDTLVVEKPEEDEDDHGHGHSH